MAPLARRDAGGHVSRRLHATAACCCPRCARFQTRWDEKKALAPAEVAKAVQVGCMHSPRPCLPDTAQTSYALDVVTRA